MVTVEATVARVLERGRQAERRRAEREVAARKAALAAVQKRLPAGARAWLIGSLAWGGFGEHSDVDLVVTGVAPELEVELELVVAHATGRPVEVLRLERLPDTLRTRTLAEGLPVHG